MCDLKTRPKEFVEKSWCVITCSTHNINIILAVLFIETIFAPTTLTCSDILDERQKCHDKRQRLISDFIRQSLDYGTVCTYYFFNIQCNGLWRPVPLLCLYVRAIIILFLMGSTCVLCNDHQRHCSVRISWSWIGDTVWDELLFCVFFLLSVMMIPSQRNTLYCVFKCACRKQLYVW